MTPQAATGRVFISYRGEETAYPAGWLYDRLVDHLGRDQVFKDIDSVQLGDDFVEVITSAVESCDVLLALIGDAWLTITDEDGHRRLENPDDFVRLEIEAALTRKVRVIPILVGEARMPKADELPPSLAALVRRQALELSPSRFDFDTSRLLRRLDRILTEVQTGPTDPPKPMPSLPSTRVPDGLTAGEAADVPSREGPAADRPSQQARRQAQPRELYIEARAELRLEHFDTAIDLFDDLLILDPHYPNAAALRDTARRSRQLAETYTSAREAEDAGDWVTAARAYDEILQVEPAYRDAATRRATCEARQQVSDLQAELRHHAAAENWQAVLEVDVELTQMDRSAADPDGLTTRAREALDAAQRAADLERRYAQARAAEDAGDWAAAAQGYDEILAIAPNYCDAVERRQASRAAAAKSTPKAKTPQTRPAKPAPRRRTTAAKPTPATGSAEPAPTTARSRAAGRWSSQRVRTFQHRSTSGVLETWPMRAVAFSPNGRWLATASDDKTARIWETSSGKQLRTLTDTSWVWAVAFSPNGRGLGISTYGNQAVLWAVTPPSR